MRSNPSTTFSDRLFFALLGGFTGAIYGLILAAFVGYFFINRFSFDIVGWCAGSFAFLGIFYENIVGEALIALLHFLWGLMNGVAENTQFEYERETQSHLRAFALIGLITGFSILVALYW